MTAIWRKTEEEWQPLLPTDYPSEEALHDLVEEAPNLLPLSGDPTLTVLGREVAIGPGYADLVAIDVEGRLTIIEIKLKKNSEARRAVVAQILTYAAYLKQASLPQLEEMLKPHLTQRDAVSIAEAASRLDQSGEFDAHTFDDSVADSLKNGAFRLVLVLDSAPSELVQLVGYLESIASGVVLDLVTVSAFQIGEEQILVPQRVDPAYEEQRPATTPTPTRAAAARSSSSRREVDGSEPFEQSIERSDPGVQPELNRLLAWARELEAEKLASLRTVITDNRHILYLWIPGQQTGLATIWNEGKGSISLWRSAFVRFAWSQLPEVERFLGAPVTQGGTFHEPSNEALAAITAAYRAASQPQPGWNDTDFYVAFGEGPRRNWDDAKKYGFISAGGGAWYSRSLKQLQPGHRVFAYIPKGNGVGGYVGVGETLAEAIPARNFQITGDDGNKRPYLEVAQAPEAAKDADNDDLAEWIVPVRWIKTLDRNDAIRDSDLFANQNSAVKLTHGYTVQKLHEAFDLNESSTTLSQT